jgi:hypothetical protein
MRFNKRLILFVAALLTINCGVAVAIFAISSGRDSRPQLSLKTPTPIVIKGRAGQVVEFDLELINPGNKKAVVHNVVRSCSCTDLLLATKECLPGQTITVKGKVRLKTNPCTSEINVGLDVLSGTRLQVPIECIAEPDLLVTNSVVLKPNIEEMARGTAEIVLENLHSEPITAEFVSPSELQIEATPRQIVVAPRGTARLDLGVLPGCVEEVDATGWLRLTNSQQADLKVDTEIKPKCKIGINPRVINLGALSQYQSPSRPKDLSVVLTGEAIAKLEIGDVQCPSCLQLTKSTFENDQLIMVFTITGVAENVNRTYNNSAIEIALQLRESPAGKLAKISVPVYFLDDVFR